MAKKEKVEKKKLSPKEQKLRQKKRKKWMWIGGIGIFLLLVYSALAPYQGSTNFGICKVYLELNERYPNELRYISVRDNQNVQIDYKSTDPFGRPSVNTIECVFKRDEARNVTPYLDKVDINGKDRYYEAEKPENIEKFNKGVPAILENMPDTVLPFFSLDDITSYKDF